MSIGAAELDVARSKPVYRRAVWLARLALVPAAVFTYKVWVGSNDFTRASMFGLLIIMVGVARAMFASAGIPLSRPGLKAVCRDLLSWHR
jgi:hypothetical protein